MGNLPVEAHEKTCSALRPRRFAEASRATTSRLCPEHLLATKSDTEATRTQIETSQHHSVPERGRVSPVVLAQVRACRILPQAGPGDHRPEAGDRAKDRGTPRRTSGPRFQCQDRQKSGHAIGIFARQRDRARMALHAATARIFRLSVRKIFQVQRASSPVHRLGFGTNLVRGTGRLRKQSARRASVDCRTVRIQPAHARFQSDASGMHPQASSGRLVAEARPTPPLRGTTIAP